MTSPTVVTNFTTAESNACITGLLEHWKSPDSTSVEFSVPALWYSPEDQVIPTNGCKPSNSKPVVFEVTSIIDDRYGPEHRCLVKLRGRKIVDWLRGEWIADIELGTITKGGYNRFKSLRWETEKAQAFTGYYYGTVSVISQLLLDAAIPDELHIRMRLRRTVPSTTKGPHSLTHELEHLRTPVDRLESVISFLTRPSIDMTRISFSSSDGFLKHLYAPSQVLLKYAYFQACHASGFSETEAQPLELSGLAQNDILPTIEDSDLKEVSNSVQVSDPDSDSGEDSDLDVDPDSDAEWELDEEEEYEHSVDHKFKATIHVKDISRRTYKAFIEWALCGALHFSPCRAAYAVYVKSCKTSMVEEVLTWPVWANDHCTTINKFGNLKTLTSPKSLYRLADKLLIPGLKAPCRKQITEDFQVATIIQEITKIRDHPELLKDAYEYVRNNWDLVVQQKNFVRIISNCPRSVSKVFHETVLTQLSSNK